MGSHVVAVRARDVTRAALLVPAATPTRLDVWPPAVVYAALAAAFATRALPPLPLAIAAGTAVAAHILLLLCAHWFTRFAAALRCAPERDAAHATLVLVRPARFAGPPALLPLQRRRIVTSGLEELSFEFRKRRFEWDTADGCFRPQEYPTALAFAAYAAARGHATPQALAAAAGAFGRNSFALPAPQFRDLLLEQLSAPFFCFQLFCVALWCLDEYWHYSVLTLLMLILFEATVAKTRLRTALELRAQGAPFQAVRAYRAGAWAPIDPADLLPGDLVSIGTLWAAKQRRFLRRLTRIRFAGRPRGTDAERCVVPADLLLLSGSAITEEALLTGESAPQWKAAAPGGDAAAEALDLKRHRQHVLFGGTKLVQHTEERGTHALRTPDGGCLAYVLRTGFSTEQGKLMRTIMFSAESVSANSREAGLFILLLLVFAVAAAGYVLHHGLQDPRRSKWKLLLHASMVLTSVIPPELPMELTIAVNTSLIALSRMGIYCTEPFRIPLAGGLDVCAFDKTGTLTTDELRFQGVMRGGASADDDAAAAAAAAQEPLLEADAMPPGAALCLGACHSLVLVEGTLAGDPLERAAVAGAGWAYGGGDLATPPRGAPPHRILRRLHFTPELRRMLTVTAPVGREGDATVLVKGAPEAVLPLCSADSLPPGCGRVYAHLAARGARVLALATRPIGTHEDWRAAPRDSLENSLRFAGFALFRCPLRASSAPALAALRRARHALILITGDAALTACFVARETHIVTRPLLLLTPAEGAPERFEWVTPEGAAVEAFDVNRLAALSAAHDLCVSGDGLAAAAAAGALGALVRHTQVYARCAPEQKEAVLQALRAAGLTALMCGDGTNDVGALKAAAVGVALVAAPAAPVAVAPSAARARNSARNGPAPAASSAAVHDDLSDAGGHVPPLVRLGDASMAAPFTAKVPSVAACVHIVRQGRAALVTTVQMFKILGLNCLVSAFALSVQYLDGVKWGDTQATVVGLASAGLFMMLALGKPAQRLASTRPHGSVFCAYALGSVALQFAAHLTFLWRAVEVAKTHQDAAAAAARHPDDDFAPSLLNTAAFLASGALQLSTFAVNYVGAPFNTPLHRNTPLLYSLLGGYAVLALAASGLAPPLAAALELVALPPDVRVLLFAGAAADLAFCAAAEHALRASLPARPSPAALRLSQGM